MKSFPDETSLPKSSDSGDVIRGGSIGLNRILSKFAHDANIDKRPQFTAVIMSAFTIFRNIWEMKTEGNSVNYDELFIHDVNLFLDYYNTYLSFTLNRLSGSQKAPVVIYFPDYKHIQKEILREITGKKLELFKEYDKFLKRYNDYNGKVRTLDHCQCFWIKVGHATYPHKEVAREFKSICDNPQSLYNSGDCVSLMTHVPLDLHISSRIRNIRLLESYTGKLKTPKEFNLRLDKEGRIPFLPITHVVFGDSVLIRPWVSPKLKKVLLEDAVADRWLTRSEGDITLRIVKRLSLPTNTFRKYDFV